MSKEKNKKNADWESFPKETYKALCEKLVHFSVKAVNSNAKAGGVRLSGCVTDLPYVSLSTFAPDKVALDYPVNAGKNASIYNQVATAMDLVDRDSIYSIVPAVINKKINSESIEMDECDYIKHVMNSLDPLYLAGDIDCHLKQIIMPDQDGNNVSLTPLHSAGFSGVINAEINLLKAEISEANKEIEGENLKSVQSVFRRAYMPYGGANTQNAGCLINNIQQPLFMSLPQENFDIKRIYSKLHNGIDLMPYKLIDKFLGWHDTIRDRPRTLKVKDKERAFFESITRIALSIGHAFKKDMELTSIDMDSIYLDCIQQGFCHPKDQNKAWRHAVSHQLAMGIYLRKRKNPHDSSQDISSGLSSEDQARIKSIIEDFLV